MKTDIKDQSEEEKKKIFAKQENVLSNAEMLLKKRGELIEQFYDAPRKSEESLSEKSEQKSDQSVPKWVQVPKDSLIL